MKAFVLAYFVLLTACAHVKIPPSFGFYSKQCVEVRKVVCLVDADMSADQCKATVVPAIKAINGAIGHPVFEFLGTAPMPAKESVAALIKSGVYVIGGAPDLPANVLGVTGPANTDAANPGCITRVYTLVSTQIWGIEAEYAQAVVLHEMVHALGAGHATSGAAYRSVETPSVGDKSWVNRLTIFDIAALRAAY